jgi:hypothetical protein
VPSVVEIVTLQAPVTSAAWAGATNNANNNIPRSPSHSSVRTTPLWSSTNPVGKVHKNLRNGLTTSTPPPRVPG